jgi:hypothetical protein
MEDASFMLITGVAPVWNDDWQSRVQMSINDHGKHRTVDEMIHQRVGNFDESKRYQRVVFDRTEAWLAQLDPAESPRSSSPDLSPKSPAPTALGSPGLTASPSSTQPSAGCRRQRTRIDHGHHT